MYMASTEAKNILLWFQVSLHTATKVIFIKFPVSKNPQGLLNNELTKKKKTVMFHLHCPNIMSMGFGFSIYTPREHSLSPTGVPLCPKFCQSWWNTQIKHWKDFYSRHDSITVVTCAYFRYFLNSVYNYRIRQTGSQTVHTQYNEL